MATVAKIKNGFRVRWVNRFGNRDGKNFTFAEIAEAGGPTTKAAAKKWARGYGEEKEADEKAVRAIPTKVIDEGITLADAFEYWIEKFRTKEHGMYKRTMARTTVDGKIENWANHINVKTPEWRGGNEILGAVDAGKVGRFMEWLEENGRSIRTLSKTRTTLKAIFSEALKRKDWELGANPANPVEEAGTESRPTGATGAERVEIDIPTSEEIDAIITEAKKIRDREILGEPVDGMPLGGRKPAGAPGWIFEYIVLAVATGLRGGELRGLRWENIKHNRMWIEVRNAANRYGDLGPVKAEASIREVAISTKVLNILREYKLRCEPNALGLLFPGRVNGKCMTPTGPAKRLTNILKELGIVNKAGAKKFAGHAFRHFTISKWIKDGLRGKDLIEPCGHASDDVTKATYWHLFKEDKAERDTKVADAADDTLSAA